MLGGRDLEVRAAATGRLSSKCGVRPPGRVFESTPEVFIESESNIVSYAMTATTSA